MHILVTNDDGPPSNQSSPYVHSLIKTLQDAGHVVSVCLPHMQRSWIGKAHITGQIVKPTYFRPGTLHEDDGTTHSRPLPPSTKDQDEWVLVNGTPASCVQIALHHFFQDRGPVDLVVSGPNYGRNTTAVFSLSSGTLGGALEAAVCKKKAIALSYAFKSRIHDPKIIADASALSVRVIQHLYDNWDSTTDLYSVNVPLVENVSQNKVVWTKVLQNYWGEGSCYQEAEPEDNDADEEEVKIREGAEKPDREKEGGAESTSGHKHRHFKWAPRFADVVESVERAGPGSDGWAVKEGQTSVTPLRANFMHASTQFEGELKLQTSTTIPPLDTLSISQELIKAPHFYALIDYEDEYVQPLILSALSRNFDSTSYTLVENISELPSPETPFLQISSYETLPFEHILSHSTSSIANAYIIRKALIRKHYLSTTSFNWTTKNPASILKTNIKPSCDFELDYAEFLDDALVEAWELQEAMQKNEEKSAEDREWWILKPGMSDRGQGIRLFSTMDELQEIFEKWEEDQPDSEDEDEEHENTANNNADNDKDAIMTSHLRHFTAQPYIHPPLLPLGLDSRKFHIRTYVLALGSLSIYVYKPMLALFASSPYTPPWESSQDLTAHLTNTCLQPSVQDGTVLSFWSPSLPLPTTQKQSIFSQICAVTGEIFEAAAKGMMIHFQTLPNAFEVFGVDFLVDEGGTAWLLEVNAFPDFKQTGSELSGIVEGLWSEVVREAVGGYFGGREQKGSEELVLVRKVELGRR